MLDAIFTNVDGICVKDVCVADTSLADHNLVSCCRKVLLAPMVKEMITTRRLSRLNIDYFVINFRIQMADLLNESLESDADLF